MDWDIEAQQLLRMCQAIRAVQFLYLTTSWLLFHSYSTKFKRLAAIYGAPAHLVWANCGSGCDLVEQTLLLVHRVNSLLGAFQLRNNIAVPASPLLLCNLLVTYSNTRFVVTATRFVHYFFLLQPVLSRKRVLFPGCPRSSNERRHCGVILPQAFFFFFRILLRQDVPFHTRQWRICESSSSRRLGRVKRIILYVKEGRREGRVFVLCSLTAPCVINSNVRMRFPHI